MTHEHVRTEYSKLANQYDSRWSFYIEQTVNSTLKRLQLNFISI